MQPVTRARKPPEKLLDPLPALSGIRVGNRHGILRRVPVTQPHSVTHLDEGGEPGKHHVDLRLVQRPCVEQGVHPIVWRLHLQFGALFLPEILKLLARRIYRAVVRILCTDAPAFAPSALPEHKDEAHFLPRLQGHILLQAAAMVAALFIRGEALTRDHRRRIRLRIVCTEEFIPHTVETVRRKVRRKVLIPFLLIK